MKLDTMCDYLRKWGFTPQKPKKKAYEQCSKKVKIWLEQEYPTIQKRAKLEDAEIHWADETGVRNKCQRGRLYAPKGKTPTKMHMSKRFSLNMISSLNNQVKVQFMIYSENMNSDRLILLLKQLIKNNPRKLFLILDI